ncbi:MAG TPA: RluA family pseudouridine synthase [Myxococcaceae bacterium]|nr:RluA family pseudouridine synthase [Myxococcaceae bacterium]
MNALRVLWRDARLVAIDKPPGMLVVPGRTPGQDPTVRDRLEAELGRRVWVVHRLDRETSGVLLFALDAESHRAACLAFEQGEVTKRYLALVAPPLERPQLVEEALVPARRGRMRLAFPGEAGKPARTRLRPLEIHALGGLVEAEPLTGRTHQVRLHLQAAGAPLLVDAQYGRAEPLTEEALGGPGEGTVLARTPLHAARLSLAGGGLPPVTIEAPMPEDMQRTLELLRRGAVRVRR